MSQFLQAHHNHHLTRPREFPDASTCTYIRIRIHIKLHLNIYIYVNINTYKYFSYMCTASHIYMRATIPCANEASARNPGRPAAWRAQLAESLVYREPKITSLHARKGSLGDSGIPASTRFSRNAATCGELRLSQTLKHQSIYKRRSA